MQRFLVRRPERDVVDRAGTLPCRRKARLHRDMKFRRRPAFSHLEDMNLTLPIRRGIVPRLAHVHHPVTHRLGVGDVGNADDDRPEPAYLVLGWHRALRPGVAVALAAVADKAQTLALGIFEIQRQVAADVGDLTRRDVLAGQALLPPGKTFVAADPQAGPDDAVGAAPFAADRPVEEGEVGARCRLSVGIEKVIGRWCRPGSPSS